MELKGEVKNTSCPLSVFFSVSTDPPKHQPTFKIYFHIPPNYVVEDEPVIMFCSAYVGTNNGRLMYSFTTSNQPKLLWDVTSNPQHNMHGFNETISYTESEYCSY